MPLSNREIDELLRLIANTEDAEANCDHCLQLVAEFAERQLAGQTLDDGHRAIQQHLDVCAECRDEYEALRRAIEDIDESSN